jgi:N-acetylglucosamine-6-phosphate deacetylase
MGLDLAAAVRRASLSPATIAGVGDRKGSLDPGKDADLVLLETKPRLDVRMTLSRGEVLYDANR